MGRVAVPDPSNYEEMWKEYFPLVKILTSKAGIYYSDVEDVASEVFTKIMERDWLRIWKEGIWKDGAKGVGGSTGTAHPTKRVASFRHWFQLLVVKYLRHHVDRQRKMDTRYPKRLEDPVGEDSTWVEVYGPEESDPEYLRVELARMVEWVHSLLEERKSRYDLPALFEFCIEQGLGEGVIRRRDIASNLDVSMNVASSMLKELRLALDEEGFREPV